MQPGCTDPKRVSIIGSGNWGSALAKIIGSNVVRFDYFHDNVTMYVFEELIEGETLTNLINKTHKNVRYLPGHKLPPNVIAEPDLIECAKFADILVFVVPHQFIRTLCSTLVGKIKPNAIALSSVKGFDRVSGGGIDLMSHIITSYLRIPCSVLMGANLANEVAEEQFCEIVIGCKDSKVAPIFRKLIETIYCRVIITDDVDTAEMCGTLNNVVACGAGFVDGLLLGGNSKAAVIRLGLIEMIKYGDIFYPGGKLTTFFESCGVADLIATCHGGRDYKVCEAFIQTGKSLKELEDEMLDGQFLQGPYIAEAVNHMLKNKEMEGKFPLFTAIHKLCTGQLLPEVFINYIKNPEPIYIPKHITFTD